MFYMLAPILVASFSILPIWVKFANFGRFFKFSFQFRVSSGFWWLLMFDYYYPMLRPWYLIIWESSFMVVMAHDEYGSFELRFWAIFNEKSNIDNWVMQSANISIIKWECLIWENALLGKYEEILVRWWN